MRRAASEERAEASPEQGEPGAERGGSGGDRMTGILAVLFDLDDTLLAHRAAVADGLVAYLGELGHPYDASDAAGEVAAWRALEEHHYHRYLGGEIGYEQQRRDRARDYAARHGVTLADDELDGWFAGYFTRYEAAWKLHDDSLACLTELRRGIPNVKLGIITNGELDRQLRKIDAMGFGERFDVIVASGDVGVTKPDARIFRLACARLGVDPREAAYVGDRLGTDAIGAAGAGLIGVWIDRFATPLTDQERAAAAEAGVARITTLAELRDVLVG